MVHGGAQRREVKWCMTLTRPSEIANIRFASCVPFSVYVALTNIPVGELLTGFAMRSDPNVVFG